MIRPYSITEETTENTTYVYNTWYTYSLYFLLAVYGISYILGNEMVSYAVLVLVLIYFAMKIGLGRDVTARFKSALKQGSVTLSGSKHSLSNPLTIVVPSDL